MAKGDIVPKGGQILIYQTEGGQTKIEVRLEGQTLWLNQAGLAELYQTTIPNINIHIKNIYEEGELAEEATIKDYLIVQNEGGRKVSRQVKHYNLDFLSPEGKRYDPDNFNRNIRNANRKAGSKWTRLDFRHTRGSQLAIAGISLYKISMLLWISQKYVEDVMQL